MYKIDLSKINLNLLIALDALLKEQHVTRAAKHLHITQSAMSHLLKQLRILFKDVLFFRGQSSRLLPTPYALSLVPELTEIIEKISHLFEIPEKFIPEKAKSVFRLGLSDYTEFVLLPSLVKHITQQAPGIQLIIKHLNYLNTSQLFESNDIDLAVGIYAHLPDTLIAQPLFTDRAVCVGAKKNPLLKHPMNGKTFAKAKQLIILYYETREDLLSENYIKQLGIERNAVITIPHTLTALYSLANTDLIATVLERAVKPLIQTKTLPLTYQPITFTKPHVTASMVWHPKDKNYPAHRWLRETIIEIAKSLDI